MLIMRLLDQGIEIVIIFVVIMSLAFAYHEFAHAIVADRLGDPTPRAYGRITLNPLPHLSLPLMITLLLFGFGGAYTPVSPTKLRGNWRHSHAWVALAGPMANLLMAIGFAFPLRLFQMGVLPISNDLVLEFLYQGVQWNVFLMVFNLVPLPPLDGFTILQGLVPGQLAAAMDGIRQYGFLILIGAFLLLPRMGLDPFGDLIFPLINQIMDVLIRI